MQSSSGAATAKTGNVLGQLSMLDRFLPLLIFAAMALGLILGAVAPGIKDVFNALSIGTVSLPIAVGLLWMMYPVLAKVKYEELGKVSQGLEPVRRVARPELDHRPGHHVRPGLGAFCPISRRLSHRPDHHRPGALHRHGADLEHAGRRRQRVLRGAGGAQLGVPDRHVQSRWPTSTCASCRAGSASQGTAVNIGMGDIAKSVLIFLGIPLAAGIITRFYSDRAARGKEWYETTFMPRLGPTALIGLLFTIVVMFSMQGDRILSQPLDVVRVAIPLMVYFSSCSSPRLRCRCGSIPLRAGGDAVVHGGQQQLRAGDRRGGRHVRHRLAGGAGDGHRPADRGAGAGRPGIRVAVDETALLCTAASGTGSGRVTAGADRVYPASQHSDRRQSLR